MTSYYKTKKTSYVSFAVQTKGHSAWRGSLSQSIGFPAIFAILFLTGLSFDPANPLSPWWHRGLCLTECCLGPHECPCHLISPILAGCTNERHKSYNCRKLSNTEWFNCMSFSVKIQSHAGMGKKCARAVRNPRRSTSTHFSIASSCYSTLVDLPCVACRRCSCEL